VHTVFTEHRHVFFYPDLKVLINWHLYPSSIKTLFPVVAKMIGNVWGAGERGVDTVKAELVITNKKQLSIFMWTVLWYN